MSDTNTPDPSTSSGPEWPGGSAGDTWPSSDPNATSPIGPPPAGAPVGLIEEPLPAPEYVDWQDKYESERKRSRIFMAATAVAAALFVGSLFYASAQGGSTAGDLAGQQSSGLGMGGMGGMDRHGMGGDTDDDQSDQGLSGPGMGGDTDDDDQSDQGLSGPGMGGPGMGVPPGMVEQFFTTDGSLDEDAVAQFEEQLEAAGTSADVIKQQLAAQIAGDVARGHITAAQAQELTEALGLPTADSGDGSGDDSGSGSST